MTTEEFDDEVFGDLLKSIARTPDVSALCREVRPGTELLGRFVVGRQLGAGGMGRVFAAFDRQRQTNVALKLLGVLTPHSIVALRREFRCVAELAHPNLVRLYELFSDGDEWFFSMELLDGRTVNQLLLERPGDIELVRHVFRQLASALAELHRAGTLHGDLKPSNFLVTGPEHRAVLLDFGVSRPLGRDQREYLGAGTYNYSAPEQIAGAELTELADWYAFGVVLFESLVGKLPARARLDADLRLAPPELAGLCRQLLQENPEQRVSAEVVHRVLGTAEAWEPSTWQRSAVPSQLFGRSAELERLFAVYSRVTTDQPQVVLVRGDSGIGKTALVDLFALEVARLGSIVLRGRCRERESTSYKAIDGLIDDLVTHLDQLPREAAKRLLPDGLAELTRLFPALRTAEVVATSAPRSAREPTSDQSILKQRAIGAFRDLLAAISQTAPLVVCIDDLQWSDTHSAALLEPILAGSKRAATLFVGVCRSLGQLHGATIDVLYAKGGTNLPQPELIDLLPLAPDAAESLARDLLPNTAQRAGLAREIAQEAAGSPLFIGELAHHVRVEPATLASAETQSLSRLVRRRVAALPADVQRVLEATALAGVPLSRTLVRRSTDLTPNRAEEAINLLRINNLVRTHDATNERSVETQHDRIREIVLQDLSADLKQLHHLHLAQALEAERTVLPEIVASHFFAAGDAQSAGRYWIKAADAAFEALAFSHAADLYRRGRQFSGLEPARLAALEVRQADALAYDGKGVAAADAYLAAAEEHHRDQAIDLRRRAAEQLLLSGHLDRGLEVIARVLRDLGMRRTRTGRQVIPSILIGRFWVRARGLRFTARKASEVSKRELARVDAAWSIACSMGVVDFMRGADFQNDHLRLALGAGEPRRLLRALTLEISYSATPGAGRERRTTQLLTLVAELAKTVDDPAARGLASVSRGVAAYLNGRFGEALIECQAGLGGLRRCSGTVWESVTAQRFVVASLFHLGRLGELAERVPPLLAEADAKGNLYASTYFRTTYSNAAWLRDDLVESAREQLRVARTEWRASGTQLPHCWMLLGECQVAFYTGETEELWQKLEPEWSRMRGAQFFRIGMVRVQLWHLRSAIALGEAWAHALARRWSEARRFNREARRCVERLGTQPLPFAKALAELMLAGVERSSGDENKARLHLEGAVDRFLGQDMSLYAAAARMRLAELIGGQAGMELLGLARGAFEAEGVTNIARCSNMLAPIFSPQRERVPTPRSRQFK